MVEFKSFKPDTELQIVERAERLFAGQIDRLSLHMDLAAVNATCPMDGEKLLSFPDGDFAHDIVGINNNINRITGELQNCFVPRCAL